jgi:hypothetical protein
MSAVRRSAVIAVFMVSLLDVAAVSLSGPRA